MKKAFFLLLLPLLAAGQQSVQSFATGEYNIAYRKNGVYYDCTSGICQIMPGLPSTIAGAFGGGHHQGCWDSAGNGYNWGDNVDAELGNGGTTFSPIPFKISQDSLGRLFNRVTYMEGGGAAGWNTMAIENDSLWVWGDCSGGLEGNGTFGNRRATRPVNVRFPAGVRIKQAHVSLFGIALDQNSNVYTWGGGVSQYEPTYVLAQGTKTPNMMTPTRIPLPETGPIAQIAGGSHINLVLFANGHLYGSAYYAQLLGTNYSDMNANGFKMIRLDTAWKFSSPIVRAWTNGFTCWIRLADRSLWAFGSSACGECGNGTHLVDPNYAWSQNPNDCVVRAPVQVAPGKNDWDELYTGQVYAFYCIALDTLGNAHSWGRNKVNNLLDTIGNPPGTYEVRADFPDSWNRYYPYRVTIPTKGPMVPVTSPYCVLNPSDPRCDKYTVPAVPGPKAGGQAVLAGPVGFLMGTAVAPQSTIIGWQWRQLSGPPLVMPIVTGATCQIAGMQPGATYGVQLSVTDNNWRRDSTTVTFTAPATTPPPTGGGMPPPTGTGCPPAKLVKSIIITYTDSTVQTINF